MLNFAQLKFLLTGLTLLTVLAACSDDNTSTEAPPATIEIAELSPEADNVSFRLIPTNAISMAYKIEIEGGGDDADFVSIESSEEKTVEITDLTPETSYKLTAIAYNADQRPSNPATATFTTPEKPTTPDPDKATISIEEVKATYNSVTFTLKTANAARFGYKVDVPDGTAELTFVKAAPIQPTTWRRRPTIKSPPSHMTKTGRPPIPSPTHSKPKPFRPAPPSFRSKRSLRPTVRSASP